MQRRGYSLPGHGPPVSTFVLFTRDRRLAAFLKEKGASPAVWSAMRRAADRHTCLALYDGRRLARLERSVARAVRRAYRAATHRRARLPDVMVTVDEIEVTPTGVRVLPCNPERPRRG